MSENGQTSTSKQDGENDFCSGYSYSTPDLGAYYLYYDSLVKRKGHDT